MNERVTLGSLRPSREARLVNLVAAGLLLVFGITLAGASAVIGVWKRDAGLRVDPDLGVAHLWVLALPGVVLIVLAVTAIRSLGRGTTLGLWIVAFLGVLIALLGGLAREWMSTTAGVLIGAAGLWGLHHSARRSR